MGVVVSNPGLPEVWRLKRNTLWFYVWQKDGSYSEAGRSLSFPRLKLADLMVFLQKARKAGDENPVVREFRDWLRRNLLEA